MASGTGSLLFYQPLLEKIVSQMKEDSFIASSVSLSNLSKAAGLGRSNLSGSDRYASPLEQPRPVTASGPPLPLAVLSQNAVVGVGA